jgi:hypothetical protein
LLLVIDRKSDDVRVCGNVSLAVIEDDHDFDTDLLLEHESEFDCVRDADFVVSVDSVSETDTVALLDAEKDMDDVSDFEPLTDIEAVREMDNEDDPEAVALDDVCDVDIDCVADFEIVNEVDDVSDVVALLLSESVSDTDDASDTEAVLLVEYSDVTVSARVRVKGMITYSPGTPTFDDVGHVVGSRGSKYVPVGPTYPPNLTSVDTSVFTRNNIIVRSLFHRIIVCTLILPP